MTDAWQSFLSAQGAQWDENGVCGFGVAPGDSQLMALEQLGCLRVDGPEARKFLQGQLTCDINLVTADHSQPGGHCNTKGRMVFSFRALALPAADDSEAIALIMHRGLLERARESLQKFIVFSRAELSVGDDYRLLGLSGPAAPNLLSRDFPRIPIASHDVVSAERGLCLRIQGERFLCLVPAGQAEEVWTKWARDCSLQGYPAWNLANIRDGLGEILPGAEDSFIPQMLNMQITGGVSFKKGCYVGQEVVARMQYLGKLKRHMRRASVAGAECPAAGEPLFTPGSGQSIGNVVLAAPADGARVELLVVTTDSAFEQEEVFLDPQHQRRLEWLPLPYALN